MATPAATLLNIQASPAAGQNFFNLDYAHDTGALISPTQAAAAVLDDPPYFTTNTSGTAVVMHVSTGAATTSGSTNPRCEWREETLAGADAAWNLYSNEHIMSGRTRINHQPSYKSSICIAQIHNAAGDVMELQTRGGTFYSRSTNDWYVTITINGHNYQTIGGTNYAWPNLLDHCSDGIEIAWKLRVFGGGHYEIYVNDMVTPKLTDSSFTYMTPLSSFAANASDSYFKAGCYVQANTTTNNGILDYGEIELRDLHCWHTGQAASQTLVFGTDSSNTVSNVRWGTKSEMVNTSGDGTTPQTITPALPASLASDDMVYCIARTRRTAGSSTVSSPAIESVSPTWFRLLTSSGGEFTTNVGAPSDLLSHSQRMRIWCRPWFSGMAAPVVSYTSGTATDIMSAQMLAIAGGKLAGADAIDQIPANFTFGASSTTVLGPTAALPANAQGGSLALALLASEFNVPSGSINITSGDSLTWAEGGEGVGATISFQAWANDWALVPTGAGQAITAKQTTSTAARTTGKSASALLTLAPANRRATGLLMAA